MFSTICRNSYKFVNGSQKQILTRIVLSVPRNMSTTAEYNFESLKVSSPKEHVFQVEMNRPEKRNAMNKAFWSEMRECFNKLSGDSNCRVVVLSGAGKMFTSGLDLSMAAEAMGQTTDIDPSRKAFKLKNTVLEMQDSFTVIEKCNKPVIAAVHNGCVGGGIDMITACDIRYCTQDAWFQIKEIDIGLAADVGTLQRLPKVVGNESLVRELAFTGRRFLADEAKDFGLVSRIFPDRDAVLTGSLELAEEIASKSPVAVQGTKVNLIYSRDHSVTESLDYIATWNSSMLQSEDTMKAATAMMSKEKPTFSKL